ncbi:uncharacterized protein LOC143011509 [Genypterus blacodes]|uniref:uncharacterized protein LOC143011509 n=1 Tax=Genypterus blacodes TaxID=154954 RepID=UPI003F76949D
MSKVQMLRAFVSQRLSSAVEEIFVLFERTITEYEDEVSRSKEENERQRKLLEAVWCPEVHLERADVQSSGLKQDDPETLHKNEEEDELWSHQEGEQLEETNVTPSAHDPVKSESDVEKVQCSQHGQSQREAELLASSSTEQMKTGADGEDGEGPEPAVNSDYSELETEDDDDWKETREPQSGLKLGEDAPLQDVGGAKDKKSLVCLKRDQRFNSRFELKRHKRNHMEEKPFICSVCGKRLIHKKSLPIHMRIHSGEKPFSCDICRKRFTHKSSLTIHIRIHSAEKPFSCSICSKRFTHNANLRAHLRVHSGEKSFSCSVCGKRFTRKGNLTVHLKIHSGDVHTH